MIFESREEAGSLLAEALRDKIHPDDRPIILAIPRGGIPIAYSVSQKLQIPMSIVVVRKLGLPWNEEAGFGAIDSDGETYLDQELVSYAKLDEKTIESIAKKELEELKERERKFLPNGYPELSGREVIVVDDGVATGYTAVASAGFAKKRGAKRVIVAVPVCPKGTAKRFMGYADEFICYHSSSEMSFAVGMFYKDFHQLSDEETLSYIEKAKEAGLWEPR
ncbi:putative phosphoribosyltransferase [Hydrogenivirga caldilitoris]|uniref:Putative phosphoribosyltransferase n=1 Tax=Hydrogenivirga caldilitoris TaxID=246264 RepID=A0A497XW19_9AQUI|nr:phosphoribosyltransferase family protein [Hydrogenivirga caldilitoris]RLJ70973.1 putative phosphoribosyltransferase [Hydrogenivirga caldilitoris]